MSVDHDFFDVDPGFHVHEGQIDEGMLPHQSVMVQVIEQMTAAVRKLLEQQSTTVGDARLARVLTQNVVRLCCSRTQFDMPTLAEPRATLGDRLDRQLFIVGDALQVVDVPDDPLEGIREIVGNDRPHEDSVVAILERQRHRSETVLRRNVAEDDAERLLVVELLDAGDLGQQVVRLLDQDQETMNHLRATFAGKRGRILRHARLLP